jgi:asparagine synthase (glutamine-hydrolysing)
VWNISHNREGKDPQLVKDLLKGCHRGPDESDLYLTEKVILSSERLSIIDLTSGRQPIQGTKDAWMIHNGEIYNQELREMVC